ncbi:MAG: hypothetical protein B5M55_05905 [Desulfococcus sp. 4484_242]|nr:MAG: hypothetical protein B5M55_05905 [Desulfococcus sp. 4484_242]
MANILVVDDDQMLCEMLCLKISNLGHTAKFSLSLAQGLEETASNTFDVVFLDVRLPDGNGLTALPQIRSMPPAPEVIIITGEGDPDGAELAIESGAWDYLEKPVSTKEIALQLARALQYREGKKASKRPVQLKREGIIGQSSQIRSCLDLVASASNNNSNVMITGETGTGKELFARAIHENSPRAGENFIVIDCAALTENLVESTLFGHEKGAFTSADKKQTGLIRMAHRGTLFLDEVGELPLSVQGAFLRVLQEHRKRKEDIKELTVHYMTRLCDRYGMGTKGLSPEFIEALLAYPWPGNVRELIHALENALSTAQNEPTLFPVHLPKKIRVRLTRSSISNNTRARPCGETKGSARPFPTLKSLVEKTEQQYFQSLVSFAGGDIRQICAISGLSRAVVYARLKKYNITRRFDCQAPQPS